MQAAGDSFLPSPSPPWPCRPALPRRCHPLPARAAPAAALGRNDGVCLPACPGVESGAGGSCHPARRGRPGAEPPRLQPRLCGLSGPRRPAQPAPSRPGCPRTGCCRQDPSGQAGAGCWGAPGALRACGGPGGAGAAAVPAAAPPERTGSAGGSRGWVPALAQPGAFQVRDVPVPAHRSSLPRIVSPVWPRILSQQMDPDPGRLQPPHLVSQPGTPRAQGPMGTGCEPAPAAPAEFRRGVGKAPHVPRSVPATLGRSPGLLHAPVPIRCSPLAPAPAGCRSTGDPGRRGMGCSSSAARGSGRLRVPAPRGRGRSRAGPGGSCQGPPGSQGLGEQSRAVPATAWGPGRQVPEPTWEPANGWRKREGTGPGA